MVYVVRGHESVQAQLSFEADVFFKQSCADSPVWFNEISSISLQLKNERGEFLIDAPMGLKIRPIPHRKVGLKLNLLVS